MSHTIKIGIIGEFDPGRPSQVATNAALAKAAEALSLDIEIEWLPTTMLEQNAERLLQKFSALWCAPGNTYQNFDGALRGIRFARENGRPFIGTCGGYQATVIEYARNVLGIKDAEHFEYNPAAKNLFIAPLSCSLVGQTMPVKLMPDSQAYRFYGRAEVEEQYRCTMGMSRENQQRIHASGFRIAGVDPAGEARILELPDHAFYLATLFVPQLNLSLQGLHPLISAYLKAAAGL